MATTTTTAEVTLDDAVTIARRTIAGHPSDRLIGNLVVDLCDAVDDGVSELLAAQLVTLPVWSIGELQQSISALGRGAEAYCPAQVERAPNLLTDAYTAAAPMVPGVSTSLTPSTAGPATTAAPATSRPMTATTKPGATARPTTATAKPPPSSNCDPNYSGCLKPNSPDYDCAGGGGNGPDYTGPVEVLGDDHHGLDSDDDGHACEGS